MKPSLADTIDTVRTNFRVALGQAFEGEPAQEAVPVLTELYTKAMLDTLGIDSSRIKPEALLAAHL